MRRSLLVLALVACSQSRLTRAGPVPPTLNLLEKLEGEISKKEPVQRAFKRHGEPPKLSKDPLMALAAQREPRTSSAAVFYRDQLDQTLIEKGIKHQNELERQMDDEEAQFWHHIRQMPLTDPRHPNLMWMPSISKEVAAPGRPPAPLDHLMQLHIFRDQKSTRVNELKQEWRNSRASTGAYTPSFMKEEGEDRIVKPYVPKSVVLKEAAAKRAAADEAVATEKKVAPPNVDEKPGPSKRPRLG